MTGTLTIWETPDDYAGFDPVGDILVLAQHRDSDSLVRSNWDAARQRLVKAAGLDAIGDEGPVYAWRASHWAVGWVEYLMVRKNTGEAVVAEAQSIADDLADYPSLDDDAWSTLETEEAEAYWKSMGVKERAYWIKEYALGEVSIFAARRDYIPQEDSGRLFEVLRS